MESPESEQFSSCGNNRCYHKTIDGCDDFDDCGEESNKDGDPNKCTGTVTSCLCLANEICHVFCELCITLLYIQV